MEKYDFRVDRATTAIFVIQPQPAYNMDQVVAQALTIVERIAEREAWKATA